MDGVIDIIRMQLLSNQNQLVKDGRIAWKTLLLLYIFSNHKLVTKRLQEFFNQCLINMVLYRKYISFEKKPKGVVYLKMDNTNDVFKEMMSRHSLDFGTVRMKRIDEFHAKSSRTIVIAPDVYFELYYGQAPQLPAKDTNKITFTNSNSNNDDNPSQVPTEDSETYENARGRVYSYTKDVKELVEFIQTIYQPAQEKAVEIIKMERTKMPNLSNLTVVRLNEIDKSNVLKGDKQDFIVSKNLDNIFLEPSLHDKLTSHINRFNDRLWYASRGIPRTLGILLHGQPGCGKTSFIKSLCAAQNRTAVIIDFKLIRTVAHLRSIFQGSIELKNGSLFGFEKNKIVYVLEDFDCMSDIFMDREKKEELMKKKKMLEEKAMDAMIDMHTNGKYKKRMKKKKTKRGKKKDHKDHKESKETKDGKKEKRKKTNSDSDNEESASTASSSEEEEGSNDDISNMKTMAQWEMLKEEEKEKRIEKMRKKWCLEDGNADITLNDFLELMDGIIEMDGRIIVMTTNCKDKIDKALLRPGRIDLDLELQPPSLGLICEIFFYMYQEHDTVQLKNLWKQYEHHFKGDLLSTAKVMNCFMYIDPKIGLETLLRAESPDVAEKLLTTNADMKNKDISSNDDETLVETARLRAIQRMEKLTFMDEGEPIDPSDKPCDLFTTIKSKWKIGGNGKFVTCKPSPPFAVNAYSLLDPNDGSVISNLWGTVNQPVELVFDFHGFKFGISQLKMRSLDKIPATWELYGSVVSSDVEPVWNKLVEVTERKTSSRTEQSRTLQPSVYYTQIKLVILSTYDRFSCSTLSSVDIDMYQVTLQGYYKEI